MPLININESLTDTQIRSRAIRRESKQLHMVMLSSHQNIYNALWGASDPQAVLDDLGEAAASLFVTGSKAVDILLSQNPNALTEEQYLPKRAPTLNQDGTVTLAPAP